MKLAGCSEAVSNVSLQSGIDEGKESKARRPLSSLAATPPMYILFQKFSTLPGLQPVFGTYGKAMAWMMNMGLFVS